jgi:hypothetical protein
MIKIVRSTKSKTITLIFPKTTNSQEAERRRQTTLSPPRDRSSAIFAHANLMAPKKESLDRAQAAGILRETTKVLLRG